MRNVFFRIASAAVVGTVLAGCSSANLNLGKLWPVGGGTEQDLSRGPAGATAYACDGGKRLFVRYLDNGAAAWVILPEREFRLNKAASTGATRYSNGNATLEVKDNAATLFDGVNATHAGCKASGG